MGKNLTKTLFVLSAMVSGSLIGTGVAKKNIWYQIAGCGVVFGTTTTAVVVGSRYRYNSEDNQDKDD